MTYLGKTLSKFLLYMKLPMINIEKYIIVNLDIPITNKVNNPRPIVHQYSQR